MSNFYFDSYDMNSDEIDFSCHDSTLFPVYRDFAGFQPASLDFSSFGFGDNDLVISEIEQFNPYGGDIKQPNRLSRNNSSNNSFGSRLEVQIQDDEFDMMLSRNSSCSYDNCISQVKTIVEMSGSSQTVVSMVQAFLAKNKQIHSRCAGNGITWNCEVADRFDVLKFQINLFASSCKNSHVVEFLRISGSPRVFQQFYLSFKDSEGNMDCAKCHCGPHCPCVDATNEDCVEQLMRWFEFDAEEAFGAVASIAFAVNDNHTKCNLLQKLSEKLVELNLVQQSILLAKQLIETNDSCAAKCLNILSPAIARSALTTSPILQTLGNSVMSHLISAY